MLPVSLTNGAGGEMDGMSEARPKEPALSGLGWLFNNTNGIPFLNNRQLRKKKKRVVTAQTIIDLTGKTLDNS